MTTLSRRFTAALCASAMALSATPALANASTDVPGYPRDEFGGIRNKTSDEWGLSLIHI